MIWSEDELNKYGLPDDDDNDTVEPINWKTAIVWFAVGLAILLITALYI